MPNLEFDDCEHWFRGEGDCPQCKSEERAFDAVRDQNRRKRHRDKRGERRTKESGT